MKLRLITIIYIVLSLLPSTFRLLERTDLMIFVKPIPLFFLGLSFYFLSEKSMRIIDWLVLGIVSFSILTMTYQIISQMEARVVLVSSFYFIGHLFLFYIFKREGVISLLKSPKKLMFVLPPALFGVTFFLFILLPFIPTYFILPAAFYVMILILLITSAISRPANKESFLMVIIGVIALTITDFLWCINEFMLQIPQNVWLVDIFNCVAMFCIAIGVYKNRDFSRERNRYYTRELLDELR